MTLTIRMMPGTDLIHGTPIKWSPCLIENGWGLLEFLGVMPSLVAVIFGLGYRGLSDHDAGIIAPQIANAKKFISFYSHNVKEISR